MRLTRAALRAQESEDALKAEVDIKLKQQETHEISNDIIIHEDSERENSTLSETDDKSLSSDRVVLKDITAENYPEVEAAETTSMQKGYADKRPRKANGKAKKQKAKEIVADDMSEANGEGATEQAVHINHSLSGSSNIDTSPADELNDALVISADTMRNDDVFAPDDSPIADFESSDVQIEEADLSTTSANVTKTPKFDPELHITAEAHGTETNEAPEDSFVGTIKTRSPSKHGVHHAEAAIPLAETTSHTPAKSISSPRVEDSVAALDALEEAIEKFAEDLPSLDALEIESPTKVRKVSLNTPAKNSTKTPSKGAVKTVSPIKGKISSTQVKPLTERLTDVKRTSVKDRVKTIETKPKLPAHRRATSVIVTKTSSTAKPAPRLGHSASKSVSSVASKPLVSFSNSPVKEQSNLVKKRVTSGPLSTSRPGFVPAKSVKPTTVASFVLPGEAIAAKLKAQREQRIKKEEEAAEEKKRFKARPPPAKVSRPSVLPRENKTSLARLSIMPKPGSENKENVAPPKPTNRKSTAATAQKNGNQSVVATMRTGPSEAEDRKTVRQPTIVSSRVVSTSSIVSTTSQSSTTKPPVNGKIVHNRSRQTITDQQREKKDKEEAAKKARAEAAERGRLASREWAEKQKRKAMALSDAKAKPQEQSIVAN